MKGLFRVLFGVFFLFLFGMVYWSSHLVELDLKKVRAELSELKAETANLNQKVRQIKQGAFNPTTIAAIRPHLNPEYPNILTQDPYFTKVLPQQLGDDFRPHGTLKRAMIGRPENLHPFNGFRNVSELISLCQPHLTELETGKYETLAPELAIKIETRPSTSSPDVMEYWVHLRDDVYWQPLKQAHFPDDLQLASHFLKKHKVTAHDFKFFFDAIMNPYVSDAKAATLRTYYNDISSVEIIDDYTFVVRWNPYNGLNTSGKETKRVKYTSQMLTGSFQPLPCFVYQYFADGQKIIDDEQDPNAYRNNSVWAQNFAHHWAKNVIVSCGPYIFEGMTDEGIFFSRNRDHYNPYAALVEGVQYKFKESFDAVWQDFKTGKIDLCTLSPNQLIEFETFLESDEYKRQIAEGSGIKYLDYVDLGYSYLGWNEAKPFFSSQKVRLAMTMALDRDRIIEQNLNAMAVPITGPFFCYSSSNNPDITPWPYNPDKARTLLEEEGWTDMDGDGIRDKMIDGKKVAFRFKLYYFVKSLSTKVVADYVATALRDVGVECQLCGLDVADMSRQFEDKSFDAIFMGWKLGRPPEDPRQIWHSSGAREKGSSNAIGFENAQIDELIETLNYEYDKANRRKLYHSFHQVIHEQAPYTFLYTPKVRLLYREYVKNLFIPRERQDLVLGADIPEPMTDTLWLDK